MLRRLYLQDTELLKHFPYHAICVPHGPVIQGFQLICTVQFINGIAYDVWEEIAQHLIDAGIAGPEKPETGKREKKCDA
jgi:hypothetical protein